MFLPLAGFGWGVGRFVAGSAAVWVGTVLCARLRVRPQAMGVPPVGDWRHAALEVAQQQE